jgi:hypothetical protein
MLPLQKQKLKVLQVDVDTAAPSLRAVNVKVVLPQINDPTAEEVQHWVNELHRCAAELLQAHPPPTSGFKFAPVVPMGGWAHASRL